MGQTTHTYFGIPRKMGELELDAWSSRFLFPCLNRVYGTSVTNFVVYSGRNDLVKKNKKQTNVERYSDNSNGQYCLPIK